MTQMKEEDWENENGASPIASIWKIEEPKDLANKTQLQKTLFALRFNGRIVCEAESCGRFLPASSCPRLVEASSIMRFQSSDFTNAPLALNSLKNMTVASSFYVLIYGSMIAKWNCAHLCSVLLKEYA